ncbi:MAG: hypothetical protein CME07_00990 [Gemmatimonadetes bacterium]|nr:hypothetical protein [Gemmatimonadota bacterium]
MRDTQLWQPEMGSMLAGGVHMKFQLRSVWRKAGYAALVVLWAVCAPAEEYLIDSEDVLSIRVWHREDLGGVFTVDSEGSITLPLVGRIRAGGLSPGALAADLTRRFSLVDRNVSQISVEVSEYNSRRVFVLGEVESPGPYSGPSVPGVWEAIREAGGPGPDAALSRVRFIPPPGEGVPRTLNLEEVLDSGDFASLPTLAPGATLLIPRMTEAVGPEGDIIHVFGRVASPGTFSIEKAGSVLEAVLAAGGPLPDGDVGRVKVVRPGAFRARVFTLDLSDYLYRGVLFPDLDLHPGDTVTIPRKRSSALWAGVRDVAGVAGGMLSSLFFFTNLRGDGESTQTPDQSARAE